MGMYYTYNAIVANMLNNIAYKKGYAFDFKVAKQTNGKYCYPVDEFNKILAWVKAHISEFSAGTLKTKLQYVIDNEATIKAFTQIDESVVKANLEINLI